MSIFFWIYRLVGTVHSGLKGGQIFVSATHRFLKKRRLIDVDVSAKIRLCAAAAAAASAKAEL